MTSVLWFRRDLRVHDHPALSAAAAGPVAALFVIDDRLATSRRVAAARVDFMLGSVAALATDLAALGAPLHVRRGDPAVVVPAFAREAGAAAVHVTADVSPYARRRDERVATLLARAGARLVAHPGILAHDPMDIRSTQGRPFGTYAPFRRRWARLPRAVPLSPPSRLDGLDLGTGTLPSLSDLGLRNTAPLPAAGETAARQRLASWVADGLADYARDRDRLDMDGTSRLGADLRWGLLSPGEVLLAAGQGKPGPDRFVDELAWREFAGYVLHHHPEAPATALQPRYRDLPWRQSEGDFAAWSEGRTGYPVVDAAMRQLVASGWMHNRARMIVASFLTKHLLIDWRRGQQYFLRHLVDGDVAGNTIGWQWAASVGVESQPYFRIFNPTAQGTRFDPDGRFVRRWVPELARVPTGRIHTPWTMTPEEESASGCVIGRDYPAPLVEHVLARQRALAFFRDAAAGAGAR